MQPQPVNPKSRAKTVFGQQPVFAVGAAVLLAGSFLYVWLRVQPLLEYHSAGPYFFRHRAFLEPFLDRPGGLAAYTGVFLSQLNHWNWLGALVFVLFQAAILVTALICLARISGRTPGFAALVPPFLLLLLRNRYGCPVLEMSIGLVLALAASAAFIWWPWRRAGLAPVVSGLISALLFYLAGLWSALLFAVLSGLFVVIQMRSGRAGSGCLVLAWVAPLLAIGLGSLPWAKLVHPWPEAAGWVLPAALYASVPVMGAVLGWVPKPASTSARWFQEDWHGQSVVVLVFLLGWVAVWITFDRRHNLQARIDYHTSCGQDGAVLAAARQAKALNHAAKVRLQLALYHTGRLAEDLFSFLNLIDDAPSNGLGEDWRAQTLPLFELGLLNDAEHMAHEALELEGPRPDLLRLLARINRLKDRPQAAQVFLNVLSLIPFQGERAHEAWPMPNLQTPAAEPVAVGRGGAWIWTNDVPHDSVGPMLDVLLAANPTNRMAFEYVMARALINLDLKKAVERLSLMDHFNYTRIPRSYEEALLLYQQVAGVQVDLPGHTIRPETVQHFREFKQAARQLQGTAGELRAIAARFGDTYWCYYYANLIRRQAAGQAPTP